MKKTTLLLVFCGLFGAHAGFVYQSGTSFTTTADLDGDGRSDLVLVDGSSATVRVGYQLAADTITWSAPRSLGLDEVTDIACGNVLNVGYDILVATEPMLNRYHIYHLDSASQPPVPTAVYTLGAGSKSVVAMDIGGIGNTAEDDLFTVSVMNGSPPCIAFWLRSDGTTLSDLDAEGIASEWSHLNEVEYATGFYALGAMDGLGGFDLTDLSSGVISNLDAATLGLSASAAYVSFIPKSDDLAQFLLWEPGQPELIAFAIEEAVPGTYSFTAPVTYDLGTPIESVQLVSASGITRLAMVLKGGDAAAIFDYDGTGAPVLLQDLAPPQDELISGFLPVGTDDLVMLSSGSGDLTGAITVDQQTFSGGQFVSTGSQTLPAIGNSRGFANVMTFESEPFVDNTPRRLQLLRAGDWSSESRVALGAVSSMVETDQGITAGLGNPQTVALGAAHPSATYTLDNQLHEAIAVYSFDAARGDELVNIMVSPDPGMYGTSVAVSFIADPLESVYYRTSPTNGWGRYYPGNPFTLYKDTTVQYLAFTGSELTIIREATYTFTDAPSDLDSDGDGIPDYVELANGLDPFESGLDGDGDGYSDLDELLTGSDPLSDLDIPASSNRVERSAVYNLAVSPLAIDGPPWNDLEYNEIGTQLRLFNASGGLVGYAKTTNHTFSISVPNPAALFEAVPLSLEPPFVAALTDTRFDLWNRGVDNRHGVEMVGIYLQPTSEVSEVAYTYQDGDLAVEASAWLDAALDLYTNQTRTILGDQLDVNDVVGAVLVERKLADLLVERGTLTNGWVSLFKGRLADKTMAGFRSSDLQSLEQLGGNGEPAYDLRTLVSSINTAAPSLSLRGVAVSLYEICSELGLSTNNVGKYPLPVDVLREFVYTGNMQSNYLAEAGWSASTLSNAYTQTTQMLAQVATRTVESLMLEVRTNSFDVACPVLYTGLGAAKSLYGSDGNPFRFPVTFTLQPGAQVSVEAFSDIDWNLCPGTDPLEVISLDLTAVPTASGADADGNLIPDEYEAMFLVGSGGLATSDLDGDGFSDLQEYLDQTDPNSTASYGSTPVDLSPPIIAMDSSDLSIGWPAAYAEAFVFMIEFTEDLPGTPFAMDQELPRGDLDTPLDLSADQRFFRVKMRLR